MEYFTTRYNLNSYFFHATDTRQQDEHYEGTYSTEDALTPERLSHKEKPFDEERTGWISPVTKDGGDLGNVAIQEQPEEEMFDYDSENASTQAGTDFTDEEVFTEEAPSTEISKDVKVI